MTEPIPPHLAAYPWYAPHLAWLADPDTGARADLTGARLTGADLSGADLTGARLTGADLSGARLTDARLTDADLTGARLTGADLTRAIGLVTPGEEEATISACVAAIAAEPDHWDQDLWHGGAYDPATAPAVGSCGTAHCLAGWAQALLPLDHPLRLVDPQDAGWALMPRAASAGWFRATTHPDLAARVAAAKAAKETA